MWVLYYRGYGEIKTLSCHSTKKKARKAEKKLSKRHPPDWIRDHIWLYKEGGAK